MQSSALRTTDPQWIRDAWRRMVPCRPLPLPEDIALAAEFIAGVVPRGREQAACVWLLARRQMPGPWPPFDDDTWLLSTCKEVYLEFDGGGYGDRRVLQLLERWARWCHREGRLDRAQLADLLGDIDHQRISSGFEPRRATRPRPFPARGVDFRFHGFDPDPAVRAQAGLALRAVLAFLAEVQGRPGRLHAFDPEGYVLDVWSSLRPVDELGPDELAMVKGATAELLAQTGRVFAYLEGSHYLEPDQGTALAERLTRLAWSVHT
tara:strand:+ start:9576 stop:10367 length:792 start_codon:yes stop_codon:yes gene_type:complete